MCRRGHKPSWIACRVIENVPLMIAWLAMMVATVASTTSGTCRDSRAQHEKRIAVRRHGAVDHDRGLAGIVEQQRRQHQAIPGEPDRPRAEMTHVGIKRLGAGGAQEHGAQDEETGEAVPEQVAKAVARIERRQHAGMAA